MHMQKGINRIREIIKKIEAKSADGDYIFRGEPECYEKVSSTLYRQYRHVDMGLFRIEDIQEIELQDAKMFTDETDEFEILTQVQHYGGKTNLIDFTTDYLIALFFACDGFFDKPGRVILLKRTDAITDWIICPRNSINRVKAQKSIFVRPPKGFIEPDNVINIPVRLKLPMLRFLQKTHGISTANIYNDLHGFINSQHIRWRANGEFGKALVCDKNDDYESVILYYTKSLNLNPQLTSAHYNRGRTYHYLGRYEEAIKDFNEVLEARPNDAEAYYNRGVAFLRKGNDSRAMDDFNKAIQLTSDEAKAYYYLSETYIHRASLYYKRDQIDRSIKDYNVAIELNSFDAKAYYGRGVAYYSNGEYDRSIEDFDKVIEMDRNLTNVYDYLFKAYFKRGYGYHQQGNLPNAIEDYTKAIELKPGEADTYNNRGDAYFLNGEYEHAVEDCTKAIELDPGSAMSYNNRGAAYTKIQDYERAIEDLNKAVELQPEHPEPYNNRGRVWLQLREWGKAKGDLLTAERMGMDISVMFHSSYDSISDFEQKNGVKLPDDITAMLQPS